jgi:hypothetical protein
LLAPKYIGREVQVQTALHQDTSASLEEVLCQIFMTEWMSKGSQSFARRGAQSDTIMIKNCVRLLTLTSTEVGFVEILLFTTTSQLCAHA